MCCGYEGTHKKTISRTIQLDPGMTLKAQEREANKQSSLLEAEVVTGKLSASEAITLERFVPLFMRDHVQRKGLSPKPVLGMNIYLIASSSPPLVQKGFAISNQAH